SEEFPFGYGDFVIHSSDGVTFHFPGFLLSHASPVFRDMFVVGNSPSQSTQVTLTESAVTIDLLLRQIDPNKEPMPPDFDTIGGLLEAARKYQVLKVMKWWEKELGVDATGRSPTILKEPMRCLALAARYELDMTARVALRDLIKSPIEDIQCNIKFESCLFGYLMGLRSTRGEWFRERVDALGKKVITCSLEMELCSDCFQSLSTWLSKFSFRMALEPSWAAFERMFDQFPDIRGCCPLACNNSSLKEGIEWDQWEADIWVLEAELPPLPS
ncbi:hypothetical protein CPB86DRAFT_710038, partial [Serendipita vermifera]